MRDPRCDMRPKRAKIREQGIHSVHLYISTYIYSYYQIPASRQYTAQTFVWQAECSHSCTACRVWSAAGCPTGPPAVGASPDADQLDCWRSRRAPVPFADAAAGPPTAPPHSWLLC